MRVYREFVIKGCAAALIFGLALAAHAQSSCPRLIEKSWRGINCLHCLHPRAPGGSTPIVETLKASCLKRTMLSFVVDGSFGDRAGEIESAVRAVRANGQELWLHLYLYNGPAQRRWETGFFPSFSAMDPVVFQSRLLRDVAMQSAFIAAARERILPVATMAKALGARVTVAPGLEDNLNEAGFLRALKLLKRTLGSGTVDQYVRSSCFKCQARRGTLPPRDILLEEHDDAVFVNRWNGILSTDGRYFRFAGERGAIPTLAERWQSWMRPAEEQGNAFLLWVPQFQDAPLGQPSRRFEQRNLRGPSAEEEREIVRFLRGEG